MYPACKSCQALETKNTDEDDKVWLTYWVLYGFTVVIDTNAGFILEIIPGYYYWKLLFFLYLQAPYLRGAQTFYNWIFKPLYKHFGVHIKNYLQKLEDAGSKFDDQVMQGLSDVQKQAQGKAQEMGTSYLYERAMAEMNNAVNPQEDNHDGKEHHE